MPTQKPRITITLEPHAYDALSRLSRTTGQPMASVVTDIFETAVPSLVRMVVVLERAAAAPKEVRAGLAAAVERAERDFLPGVMASLDQSDLFLADLEAAADGTATDAQRPSRRRRAKQTPVL